jgi:hypothetical protein
MDLKEIFGGGGGLWWWTGFIWLRAGAKHSNELFHKMPGIAAPADKLLAFQGLHCMELVIL